MPISQIPGPPCWYATYPGGEEYGNLAHYSDEAGAREAARDRAEVDPAVKVDVGQFQDACWQVTCNECEETIEDDEAGWDVHCLSRAEAEHLAASYDWTVTADGAWCQDDTPEDARPLVTEQIPGQGSLI
jgi:hypothetical protein